MIYNLLLCSDIVSQRSYVMVTNCSAWCIVLFWSSRLISTAFVW